MKRYLLFDSGCIKCSKVARTIEKEVNGWLVADSLHNPQMQELLDRVKPDWHWEPTLLEINGEQVTVFTRTSLVIHLLRGLGLRKTWQIAQLIHEVISPPIPTNMQRRRFLGQSGALLGSLALLGLPKPNSFLSGLFLSEAKIENWEKYVDPDYGFTLEYPSDWKMETTIQQAATLSDADAIIKRLTFTGAGGMIDLDIWLANGKSMEEWLDWYVKTRRELPINQANSRIAGNQAVTFVEHGTTVDLLTSFFSDGKYVYRLWYSVTQDPQGLQVYWHMLDTFAPSQSKAIAAVIPEDIRKSADEAMGTSRIKAGNFCCNRYSSYCSSYFPCCNDQGNCTWWVCYSYGAVPFRGDAVLWWGQVPNYPDWTHHTVAPKKNQENIAYWNTGHVAYIANYTGGANVNITEMSWCTSCYNARAVSIDNPYGFIYEKYPPSS